MECYRVKIQSLCSNCKFWNRRNVKVSTNIYRTVIYLCDNVFLSDDRLIIRLRINPTYMYIYFNIYSFNTLCDIRKCCNEPVIKGDLLNRSHFKLSIIVYIPRLHFIKVIKAILEQNELQRIHRPRSS